MVREYYESSPPHDNGEARNVDRTRIYTKNNFNSNSNMDMNMNMNMNMDMDMNMDTNMNTNDQNQNQNQNCRAANDLISSDLLRLSSNDRDLISEELHGVKSLAYEEENNQQYVSNALHELDRCLGQIPYSQKEAFVIAQRSLQSTYVNDREFRLKFLRCKLFNVTESAKLIINYLEVVRELYGDVCLGRPIYLDDIQKTKEERNALYAGYIQLLPFGDRSGRRIIVILTDALFYSTQLRVKIFLYLWTVASNDVMTQRNGAILIIWDGRKDLPLPRPSEQQLIRRVFAAIPVRICAIHFCFPDTIFFRMARAIFTLTVGKAELRNRLRFHVGTDVELKYTVGTFGIPSSVIPITEAGNVKTVHFNKWIKMRTIVEQAETSQMQMQMMQMELEPIEYDYMNSNNNVNNNNNGLPSSFVEYPGPNDVLFRKGMSLMYHRGNDFFHGLIQSKLSEHDAASQSEKTRIAWSVVDEVKRRQGQFLTWHNQGWWTRLEDESKIRLRVAVFFRESKKNLKSNQNRQMMTNNNHGYSVMFEEL